MAHDSSERVRIQGGCHCKAVRFEADVERVAEILDCNCSICSMTGFRHLIVPHGDFRLLRGEDRLIRYRFGTGAADHLFCGACGVRSEEHTSELQSLMRSSYAVFCLKKKTKNKI